MKRRAKGRLGMDTAYAAITVKQVKSLTKAVFPVNDEIGNNSGGCVAIVIENFRKCYEVIRKGTVNWIAENIELAILQHTVAAVLRWIQAGK